MKTIKKYILGLVALGIMGCASDCSNPLSSLKNNLEGRCRTTSQVSETPKQENNAPEIISPQITKVDEGEYFCHQTVAKDKDGDALTYNFNELPEWLNDEGEGKICGTAPEVYDDTKYSINEIVSDGKATTTNSFELTVRDISVEPPIDPIDPPVENQAPETAITRNFGNGLSGEVAYDINGTDSDGNVSQIKINPNGGDFLFYDNPYTSNTMDVAGVMTIQAGNNSLEAIAIDDEGLEDATPAISSFYSPTEAEARTKIEEILDARSGEFQGYITDVPVNATRCDDTTKNFYVDYQIVKNDSTNFKINNIGYMDNSTNELDNKNALDCSNKTNLYLRGLPLDEIESRLNSFLDNNL